MTEPGHIRVSVLFFAVARDAAGASETTMDLPPGATVGTLWNALTERTPALGAILRGCRAAVDEVFAPAGTPLADGQTVAVLPPVSGG